MRWGWRFVTFRGMFANRNRAMWLLSICGAGMPVGGGSDDRRMCTVVYYNNPKTPVEDAATRERARSNARSPEHFNRPGEPLYDPQWVANPAGSEKRQQWIDRLQALGFLDTV